MQILITGGGYLGSVIANVLVANEYDVTVVDNYNRDMSDFLFYMNRFDNYHFVNSDIRDTNFLKTLKKYDIIVNTAALSGEPLCKKFPEEAKSINTDAIYSIIKNMRKDAGLIQHSTGSVYGKLSEICTESSNLNPISIYARTKLDAESIIRNYANYIIHRFSTAYGLSGFFRSNLLLNDLVYQAIHNKNLLIYQADFRRSFVHTLDIAECILASIENFEDMKNNTYNVGSEEGNLTKREAAEKVKHLVKDMFNIDCYVAYADNGYQDPDQRDYTISFEKIKPFWQARISMDRGLRELCKGVHTMYLTNKYR